MTKRAVNRYGITRSEEQYAGLPSISATAHLEPAASAELTRHPRHAGGWSCCCCREYRVGIDEDRGPGDRGRPGLRPGDRGSSRRNCTPERRRARRAVHRAWLRRRERRRLGVPSPAREPGRGHRRRHHSRHGHPRSAHPGRGPAPASLVALSPTRARQLVRAADHVPQRGRCPAMRDPVVHYSSGGPRVGADRVDVSAGPSACTDNVSSGQREAPRLSVCGRGLLRGRPSSLAPGQGGSRVDHRKRVAEPAVDLGPDDSALLDALPPPASRRSP